MSARYYNLMPRTPENDRIRKTLEVYDLKRNTSEPTYYLKHTVPSGVNKITSALDTGLFLASSRIIRMG